jgi:cytochrome c oxidase subunit 2
MRDATPSRRRAPRAAALAAAAAVLAAAPAASAAGLLPEGASRNGHAVDELFRLANILAGAAFIAVIAILSWCLWAYRERPGHRAVHDAGDSPRARMVTGIFAAGVFLALDVTLAVKDHSAVDAMYGDLATLDASNAEVVEVLAKQFQWHFRYPGPDGAFATDDDIRTQVLRVPDDRPTVLRMRSVDVIHSFFLPHFRTKQDVLPGMTTSLAVRPRAGVAATYEIVCAELCGLGHHLMRGEMQVLDRASFDAWKAAQDADVREFGRHTEADDYWDRYRSRGGAEGGR